MEMAFEQETSSIRSHAKGLGIAIGKKKEKKVRNGKQIATYY